ncbi:hypothetical protein DAPK24_046760 [Pichia kluyveri]|uniref:Uncharacterized protein n=1 Tax=Pichia kluyveri TaxID=36015 RepID=A0AAV5R9H4_PICKL|nr:hypothetical protein DAPK24_046760 [Pichia kluyveri]
MNITPMTTVLMKNAAPIISPKANVVLPVLNDVYVDMISGDPLANASSVIPDTFSGIFKYDVIAFKFGTRQLPATSPMDPNNTTKSNISKGIPIQWRAVSDLAIQ